MASFQLLNFSLSSTNTMFRVLQRSFGDFKFPDKFPDNQLKRRVFVASMLPFIGFGCLDNSLMLLFGDEIDNTLGVSLGLSTMAAAALGNAWADVAGVFASSRVEHIASRLGFSIPVLPEHVRETQWFRRTRASGSAVGVFIGCVIGMWPLLAYDPGRAEKAKLAAAKSEIFKVTVETLCECLKAKNGSLWLIDSEKGVLYTRSSLTPQASMDSGILAHVAKTGEIMNIQDIKSTPFYDSKRHDDYNESGYPVRSLLCVPIINVRGEILGVIELANKVDDAVFTEKDEDVLAAVSSHVANELTQFKESRQFKEVIKSCANSMTLSHRRNLGISEKQRVERLLSDVMTQVKSTLHCDASFLVLVDTANKQLVTRTTSKGMASFKESLDDNTLIGKVATTGKALMRNDITNEEYHGIQIKSALIHPVFDSSHKVIGVISALNKESSRGFTETDNSLLKNIASHIALNMEGEGSSLKKIIRIVKDQHYAAQTSLDTQTN